MFGYRRCQGRLTMINVTDCSYVYMRLGSLKLFLGHLLTLPFNLMIGLTHLIREA
jgi:hypothetical protein